MQHGLAVTAIQEYSVFYIIVSAWTCMIMEFNWWMVFSFSLVLSVLVALPPLW